MPGKPEDYVGKPVIRNDAHSSVDHESRNSFHHLDEAKDGWVGLAFRQRLCCFGVKHIRKMLAFGITEVENASNTVEHGV